jgi:hypothetical protein
MDSVKDFYFSEEFGKPLKKEAEDVDIKNISKIEDVKLLLNNKYIKIKIKNSDGKVAHFIAEAAQYKKWLKSHKEEKPKNSLKKFISEFMKESKSFSLEGMNEIVDDNGDIMSSDDMPNNATNSMVGSDIKYDSEKYFRSNVSRSLRYYSGALGYGMVVW